MVVWDQRPLIARLDRVAGRPGRGLAGPLAAVDERAGVARVVQSPQNAPVRQLGPDELALVRAAARPRREPEPFAVERVDDGARGAGPRERLEQMRQRLLDGAVGIEHDLAGGVVDEADRQWGLQLAAA